MPRIRAVHHAVAIAVPAIPIVALRRRADLVTRIRSRSPHRSHIARFNIGNSLRRGNLRLALAHNDDAVAIRPHFDAEHSILVRGMNPHVRRIDLRLRLALAKHGIIRNALRHLHLNELLGEVRKIHLGIRPQPQNIRIVKLHLPTPAIPRGNFIAHHHRLIQDRRRPVA
jgi:hypothetical protein